jgi:hypothetical protein
MFASEQGRDSIALEGQEPGGHGRHHTRPGHRRERRDFQSGSRGAPQAARQSQRGPYRLHSPERAGDRQRQHHLLGPEHVIPAVDKEGGHVVIHGWKAALPITAVDAVRPRAVLRSSSTPTSISKG